jgi:hydroxyacylglutathione hydrolase
VPIKLVVIRSRTSRRCDVTETVTAARKLDVVVFEAPGLGDRSYLLHDGAKAVVVDPQRDPHPYLKTAEDLGLDLALVLETHVHNDYVSGGLALARRAGATYGVPAGVPFQFSSEAAALEEGDVLRVGDLTVTVLLTPGHTPHHLAFLVTDANGTSAVLTGGSLLPGGTGRTDLFGRDLAVSLGEAQWRSVRRLLDELDPGTSVLPTHGFGSFCSAATVGGAGSESLTIGSERRVNPAARLDLGAFVEGLLAKPLPIPGYYAHMAPINRAGATEPIYEPVPVLSPTALMAQLNSGTAVVDIRPRRTFAASHLRGTLNIELAAQLPTYLGWLVPFYAPFVVLSETADDLLESRRLLSRIGRELPVAWAQAELFEPAPVGQRGHFEVASFRSLAQRRQRGSRPRVLDVRFPHEWDKGHIRAAQNVPLPDVASAIQAFPADEEMWVHCAAGYRAAIAASMLSARGRPTVLVDDSFDNAVSAGLEVVTS